MLRKDSISDESILSYPNMDVYLAGPQSNLNVMPPQKSMNQITNVQQPNCNMYMANKQIETMRPKQCSMRQQIIPNQTYINNGVVNYRQINSNVPCTEISQLYQIGECCNPIDKLTLPVSNGQLYGPSSLPSNQTITEVVFMLPEVSLAEIMKREDLDIVLLSRLAKENSPNNLRWPPVCISVNDFQISLDTKAFNKIPVHLPQYIKSWCVIGRNVVKFEIFDPIKFNIAAFEFDIHMVHRPTIANAKQLATNGAFVSDEWTFKLLRENSMYLNRDFINVSTLCPFTMKKIEIPARLKVCTHLQPFDLVPFLKMQARWMSQMCPCCTKSMMFNFNGCQQNIVIDKMLSSIFEKTPVGCDMVSIAVNGSYQTIPNTSTGVEFYPRNPYGNNVMISGRHGLPPHVPEINGNMIIHQSQPLPPNYRPSDQSMNFQIFSGNQYRTINTPLKTISIDSRSMLDLHPSDEQSMHPGMKYPHQAVAYGTEKPLVKKPVKRKLPRKSTPKTKIDANPNLANPNTNQISNGAITPPSTRTSSVASTSSPDSLNVPHLNLKRPPSIDLLPGTVLSDCHLSVGDEMGMFSAATVSHMNNLSFNNPTPIHHQPQQQQPYQHLYQLPPESKPLANWPIHEQIMMQQQLQHQEQQFHQQQQQQQQSQHQLQQQQHQQHQLHQLQQQQQQQQQQNQLPQHQSQQQQQQLQQQHHHHQLQQVQQYQLQQQQFQQQHHHHHQQQQQQQHHHQQQQQQQQQQLQQKQSQLQIQQQPDQPEPQQFNPGLSSSAQSFYPNHNSVNSSFPNSVKQESLNYPGSVKQDPLNFPGSVKQEPLNYPNSVKQELLNYPGSVKQELLNYPGSVKQELLNYPGSVKQDPVNFPGSVKQEILNYPPSVKQESVQCPGSVTQDSSLYNEPVDFPLQTACSTENNNSSVLTHQEPSNSSCHSAVYHFVDNILSSYEQVPEIDDCPWLDGFNSINLHESINLSDMEDL